MRGVMTIFMVVIFLVIYSLWAPAMVEGVGEKVKETGMLDDSEEAIIDDWYDALFVKIPLVLLFGFGVWSTVWYIKRQQTTGRIR